MQNVFKKIKTNYARGMAAEIYAAAFLVLKGYRVLEWRYKTPVGEVDLILKKGQKIVFAEVKLRDGRDTGVESITPQMKSRISRAATLYMSRHPDINGEYRFDVIVVSGFRVWHLDNAWFAPT